MLKKVGKLAIVGALTLGIVGITGLQEPVKVEAAKKVLPDNHTIEQLDVKFDELHHGYIIDVGNRVGTLLIRIDPPKKERDVEWLNHSITKPRAISLPLHIELDRTKQPYPEPINFSETYNGYLINQGFPDEWGKRNNRLKYGLQKFSSYDYPNMYLGLAIYLDKPYSKNGKYWFGGDSYLLKEDGQVKAYFFENHNAVIEAYERIKPDGTFPLMNKVMWGKTELWKGQLGKVTIKKPTTLWKRLDNGKLEKVRDLKVGDEYRVYRYLDERNGLYGVGAGMYVERNPEFVLYETPSKRNLRLVRIMHGEV